MTAAHPLGEPMPSEPTDGDRAHRRRAAAAAMPVVQLDLFGDTDVDLAIAQVEHDRGAAPAEWVDAWDGSGPSQEELQEEAKREPLSVPEKALWLALERERLRRRNMRHGRKTLSWRWHATFGYYMDPTHCQVLADRGRAELVRRGQLRTEEAEYANAHQTLDDAQAMIEQGFELAAEKAQSKTMVEAGDALRVLAMERAKLSNSVRQISRRELKADINQTTEHRVALADSISRDVAVIGPMVREDRQALPAAVEPDEDEITDAELVEDDDEDLDYREP